jgi:hypothetical protein
MLVFAAWWSFLALLAAVGTCGEDSDLSAAEYVRLCGGSDSGNGRIYDVQLAIAVAAAIAGVGLGAAAVLRRTWWPVLLLCAVLAIGGAGSFLNAV